MPGLKIILLASLLLMTVSASASRADYFLSLADIHFDPFIACYAAGKTPCPLIQRLRQAEVSAWPSLLAAADMQLSAYRMDTGYPLLISSLAAAKKAGTQDHVKFVLVLGDFIGHDFKDLYQKYARDFSREGYQAFVKKTLQFVTNEMAVTFPDVNVYPVIGNNDTYSSDYRSEPYGAFFRDATAIWMPLIKTENNRAAMRQLLPAAGYYAEDVLPDPPLKLIVLNSVLFSYRSKWQDADAAARKELDWLHDQLAHAKASHQKVLIAMHIPLGIDVYATLRMRLFTLIELWKPEFSKRFKKEFNQYHDQIVGVFTGHLHSDWFQILPMKDGHDIAITGTPSVSPIFGNNPGFKIYRYSTPSDEIDDYLTYYFPLNNVKKWGFGYDFKRIYQLNCHNCSVIDGIKFLQQTGELSDHDRLGYTVSALARPTI